MKRSAIVHRPMVTRVLLVVLTTVLAVQLANFVLLEFAPIPGPPTASVAQVATVLRTGRYARANFRLQDGPVTIGMGRGRAVYQGAALARELRVDADRIRLAFVDPPMIWAGRQRLGSPERQRTATRDTVMVGDFTAALRLPDGRWRTLRPVRSGLNAWRLRMLFWLLTAIVTAAPFAWLLSRWVTRPIALFAEAAARIGRNPRTEPLAVEGPREIADAARAMNDMQRQLNRYVDDRTVMIGAIAHDLRTPLMRLGLRLEHVSDELRVGVERDLAEMQAMIAAAASYVRGATIAGTRRQLDLRSLAESVVDDHSDRGGQVTLLSGEPLIMNGDPIALKAVLDNLVGNALRYAGDAEVDVRRRRDDVIIEVRDHGPGVSEEDLDHVFEPFFRGERSRNRDTGGMGLGLASVRSTAHLHGGEATVGNHPDGGLIARVLLPTTA